jgi:nucleoside-diphosphate-sugar epimerase
VSVRTILLTGETGFLGKRVRRSLEADPGIALRTLSGRLGELEPGPQFAVDVVIHLAAWTTKQAGSLDLGQIVDANVVGLQRLLTCLDPPPRRMLFASTTDVYGIAGGRRLDEGSPLDPTDAYAVSKLLGEHLIMTDASAREYEASVVRVGHIYGPGEEAYSKFVPTAINALMCGRPPTVVGNGETKRDLLYVDSAAKAFRRLAVRSQRLPELVNLASSDSYSLNEIAQTLIDIVGFIGRVRYLSDRPNPASVSFDTRLLSETIGALEEVPLAEGLRSEVEHVVANERRSRQTPSRA